MLLLLLQRVVKLEVAAALQSPPIGGRDTEMLVLTHTHTHTAAGTQSYNGSGGHSENVMTEVIEEIKLVDGSDEEEVDWCRRGCK